MQGWNEERRKELFFKEFLSLDSMIESFGCKSASIERKIEFYRIFLLRFLIHDVISYYFVFTSREKEDEL